MLFNSYVFMLVFLPAVLLLWYALAPWPRVRLGLLTVASYVFYGWNRWDYVFLLLISTLIDYVVGKWLHVDSIVWRRRLALGVSLASNLGMLGYFKYCGFFAESANAIMEFFRTGDAFMVPQIALPVGISFYTFQTLSYSIDLYRREIQPAKSLIHFAAYVSMFPQLIAGPIVRYKDIEDQMNSLNSKVDWSHLSAGIWFFVIGMSQKILVADSVATYVDPLLVDAHALNLFTAWYALLGYSVQLYFDFAGYSNMAIGLGYFVGFQFPTNFNSPYKAVSIQDFWRRWHISLSTFLRDYLYIPLGGNRCGKQRAMINLFLVMLLGGLWHGASWTFVLWGAYHGLLLIGYTLYRNSTFHVVPRVPAVLLTFLCVIFGWLLFRSTSLEMIQVWSSSLLGFRSGSAAPPGTASIVILVIALAIAWFAPNAAQIKQRTTVMHALAAAALLSFCVLRFDAQSPFLYFQF